MLAVAAAGPLVTFVHEMGHAGAALKFTKASVYVQVGGATRARRVTCGRLVVSMSPLGPGGFCRSSRAGLTRRQALIGALGGCGANVLVGLLCVLAGLASSGTARALLLALAALNALRLHNLIPRHCSWNPVTRGWASDGLQAWCLLRGRPIPSARHTSSGLGLRDAITAPRLAALLLWQLPLAGLWFLGVGGPWWWNGLAISAVLQNAGVRPSDPDGGAAPNAMPLPRSIARPHPRLTRASATPSRPIDRTAPFSAADPPVGALKICPRCRAAVVRHAKVCYCLHTFT
jgi:hypothetical protein